MENDFTAPGHRSIGRRETSSSSREGPPDAHPRRRLSVGGPDDLLASIPVVLGFVPTDSVVMLSLAGARGPHARVDLAAEDDHLEMARALVAPAVAHGVEQVALVVHAPLDVGEVAARTVREEFETAGVEVAALLVADGKLWRSVLPGRRTVHPREYDALGHRFVAEAVMDGRVVLSSREGLVDAVRCDPVAERRVRAAAHAAPAERWEPAQVAELLAAAASQGRALDDLEVARLRDAVREPLVRDAAWSWVTRDVARAHVDLWRQVVRSSGPEAVAAPAAVLAFHAWLAGDGALAWCALDRAGEGGLRTTLGDLVADLLTRAVVPSAWSPLTGYTGGEVPHRGVADSSADSPGPGGPVGADVVVLAERRTPRAPR